VDPSGLGPILPCVNGTDPTTGNICATGTTSSGSGNAGSGGGTVILPNCYELYIEGFYSGNPCSGGQGFPGTSTPAPPPLPTSNPPRNLTPANPCSVAASAPDPSYFAQKGEAASPTRSRIFTICFSSGAADLWMLKLVEVPVGSRSVVRQRMQTILSVST
jgi:hypothetical protein